MPSVGAVTSNLNIVSKTSAYTAIANDFVLADATSAAVTITLPANPAMNTVVAVKKTDATTSAVSVVPSGTATIDGDTAAILAVANASITLQFDGTNWRMVSTATINTANGAAGLPTGGASGAVLTKNSASNYDASWAATSSGGGGGMYYAWASGRTFYGPPVVATQTASTGFANKVFFPVRIPNACVVQSISVAMGSPGYSSSNLIYIGLWADNPSATSKGPAARLYSSAGNMSSTDKTAVTVSMANCTFTGPTNVWVGFGVSSTGFSFVCHANTMPSNVALGGPTAFAATGSYVAGSALSASSVTYDASPVDASAVTMTPLVIASPVFMFTIA